MHDRERRELLLGLISAAIDQHDRWASRDDLVYVTAGVDEAMSDLVDGWAEGAIPGDCRRLEELVAAVAVPWCVLISGYDSALYADRLAAWHADRFTVSTRAGHAVERLWANFPRPSRLHDYRTIGDAYPERWRIRKRQRSWVRMLRDMPPVERNAMLMRLRDEFGDPDRTNGV